MTLTFAEAQEQPFEKRLIDCLKNAFDDKGVAFDAKLASYETAFVALNKLPDNSGASYKALFEKMKDNPDFKPDFPEEAFTSIMEDVKPNKEKLQACQPTAAENEVMEAKVFRDTYFFSSDENAESLYQNFAIKALESFTTAELEYTMYKLLIFVELENIRAYM
jgi:cell division protein YceG involved in septum cleavage